MKGIFIIFYGLDVLIYFAELQPKINRILSVLFMAL